MNMPNQKNKKNSKKVLTFQKSCDRIDESMERWLSWSKAHDWKSCDR